MCVNLISLFFSSDLMRVDISDKNRSTTSKLVVLGRVGYSVEQKNNNNKFRKIYIYEKLYGRGYYIVLIYTK